jgi:hypothetical protein
VEDIYIIQKNECHVNFLSSHVNELFVNAQGSYD